MYERYVYWLPLAGSPAGDLALNPGMCPVWKLNQRPISSQDGAQSAEPQQPGLLRVLLSSIGRGRLSWDGLRGQWMALHLCPAPHGVQPLGTPPEK